MTRMPRTRLRAFLAIALAAAALPAWSASPVTAVPPADLRAGPAAKATAGNGLLAPNAASYRIALPEPTAAERASLAVRNAPSSMRGEKASKLKGPLALAFPRDVPATSRSIPLATLAWQTLSDGSHAARIDVVSPGAAALRVALQVPSLDPGVTLRFTGNGSLARVFGPVPADAAASDTKRFGRFWTPVLDGDVATVELHVQAGVRIPAAVLDVAGVSHQVVAPSSLDKMSAKDVHDIGTAGSCNIDVACVTPQSPAFADSRKAVAAIEFTQDDGFTYLCTGTLLNDSVASNTPYFFSANHCLDGATAARTLNTFWFFDAVACGSKSVPSFVQQASGATMLARSADWDWSLVRLNAAPPAGVKFSAWRAEPMPSFPTVSVLHHPEGDLKKWSGGKALGYRPYSDGSSFAQVQYDQGTTEPGSSGAGLLTYFDQGGYYEVRGGLWRGDASCSNPNGIDEYSRLDNMLPLTREYLTPDSPGPAGLGTAVEYYDRTLDRYLLTSSSAQIRGLDTAMPQWERTGLRFMAYQNPTAGTTPVCQIYGTSETNAESVSVPECQAVINDPASYPGWSANEFYLLSPDAATGACPDGAEPVWRFLNEHNASRRYTTDHTVRDAMREDPSTWMPEGYGPDSVTMCTPSTPKAAALLDLDQHGLTGSWYEPATNGQGFEIEIYPDFVAPGTALVAGAWFTFDTAPAGGIDRQRWYTFSGNAQRGSASVPVTIYRNVAGNFDALPITSATAVGFGTLAFADCMNGTFDYTLADGRAGNIPLTRITPNVTCVTQGAPATNPDFAFSGNWYDPATSGQGFVIEMNPLAPVLFFTWYTYAPAGQDSGVAGQRWYSGQAPYVPGSRANTVTLYETTGGVFDDVTSAAASRVPVGTSTIAFANCNSAQLQFNFTSGSMAGRSGTIALARVGPVPPGCVP